MKSAQIRSYFWSVFSCIRTEYRKIRTRNNSVFGHFSRINYFAIRAAIRLKSFNIFWLVVGINLRHEFIFKKTMKLGEVIFTIVIIVITFQGRMIELLKIRLFRLKFKTDFLGLQICYQNGFWHTDVQYIYEPFQNPGSYVWWGPFLIKLYATRSFGKNVLKLKAAPAMKLISSYVDCNKTFWAQKDVWGAMRIREF